ncbi:Lrp/AsnC family transcriptional regulator [Bordetella sp. 15P40C-2]|uniref:Lrp/AsnC family transcriptional regulator n=1 Tax=Bordetella sp. 15P40C-2 TaxID=2572246 RepID=UPI00132901E3|nr:Lrp/AsnC family transcriptional regulator [Bordetella sp. 15P40C-2]MVW71045.1 winged helix-turn-helix transcriptional regulator [Bordetella sp. 15P40C-2]
MEKIDKLDMAIISALQNDGALSQRELAERVGLSQNACWRRLQRLNSCGIIQGTRAQVNLVELGFDLTVFVMIRTSRHAKEWADEFRQHVERLPEVTGFYRIGGDWDYLIKVACRGMAGYDRFYQRLITGFELTAVTGFFSMEAIIDNRPPDLRLLDDTAA